MIKQIEEYIKSFPDPVQERLIQIHSVISGLVPEATEKISYGMPTFYLKGNLVHYAGYKKHIGFYPDPSAIAAFENELGQFKWAKGSVQFPNDKALPIDLIRKMVIFRKNEQKSKK